MLSPQKARAPTLQPQLSYPPPPIWPIQETLSYLIVFYSEPRLQWSVGVGGLTRNRIYWNILYAGLLKLLQDIDTLHIKKTYLSFSLYIRVENPRINFCYGLIQDSCEVGFKVLKTRLLYSVETSRNVIFLANLFTFFPFNKECDLFIVMFLLLLKSVVPNAFHNHLHTRQEKKRK